MLKVLKYISWLLYVLSGGILIINIVALEYGAYLAGICLVSFGLLFIGSFIIKVKKGQYLQFNKAVLFCGVNNKKGRILCGIVTIISLAIIVVSLVCSIIYGGSPNIVNGVYCITYKNHFVKELTLKEYTILYAIYQEVFPCFSLLCNSLFLGNITVGSAK